MSTILNTERMNRYSILPTARELADEIAAGATIDDLAAYYDHAASTIGTRIVKGGYSTVTGQPLHDKTLDPLGITFAIDDRPWEVNALCSQTDPEQFYPEKGGSTREAKAVCRRCEVRTECLEWALANGERFGIWGGLSERERRKLTKTTHHNPLGATA